MARWSHLNPRTGLAAAATVLALLAVVPGRFTPFAGWFAGVADFVVSPVSAPASTLVRWLVRPTPTRPSDPLMAMLKTERDQFKDAFFRERAAREQLQRQLDNLSRAMNLSPTPVSDGQLRLLSADVLGSQGGGATQFLRVRAGSDNGLTEGSVAVYDAVHLVGRVPVGGVSDRTARVLPITDRGMGAVTVAVFPLENPANPAANGAATEAATSSRQTPAPDPASIRLAALLTPDGAGGLSGLAEAPRQIAGAIPPTVTAGMVARLDDPRWPPEAQMLIVGVVQSVASQPNGRQVLTVRPVWRQPLAEVTLRVTSPLSTGQGGPTR